MVTEKISTSLQMLAKRNLELCKKYNSFRIKLFQVFGQTDTHIIYHNHLVSWIITCKNVKRYILNGLIIFAKLMMLLYKKSILSVLFSNETAVQAISCCPQCNCAHYPAEQNWWESSSPYLLHAIRGVCGVWWWCDLCGNKVV